jgi:hypothetical protein
MNDALTYWQSEAPAAKAFVMEIDHFDARGMSRVYGRGDHFGRYRSFHMDIWKTRDGRLKNGTLPEHLDERTEQQ